MTKAAAVRSATALNKHNDRVELSPRCVMLGLEDKKGIAQEIKVSRRTIDNYMARRVIPFIRIGRVVRFDVARVRSALRRFEVRAAGDRS
jgi:hypothetical protein